MKFLSNGFLVTSSPEKIGDAVYHGVDTEPWPLGTSLQISSQWLQQEEACYLNLSFVFLAGLNDTVTYFKACQNQINSSMVLCCEISAPNMQYKLELHKQYGKSSKFLGYDYAYPSGSYYSAIVNDIICRTTPLSKQRKTELNQNGLFSTEDALCGFIRDRGLAVSQDKPPYFYEHGDFVAFRLFYVETEAAPYIES